MLDFEADGIGQLNTIAGYFVASALVCLGIAIAAGAVMLAAGRGSGLSRSQEKGLKMIGIGAAGAMVLASLGGAIAWSIERGQTGLMPEEARPQDVVVEREAPSIQCVERAVRNFDKEENPPSQDERREIALDVLNHQEPPDGNDAYLFEQGSMTVQTLKWYPSGAGGSCSTSNQSAADCTDVEVVSVDGANERSAEFKKDITVGEDCE